MGNVPTLHWLDEFNKSSHARLDPVYDFAKFTLSCYQALRKMAEEHKDPEFADDLTRLEVQVRQGFPAIFNVATISLWAILEALLEDFWIGWILHEPSKIQFSTEDQAKGLPSSVSARTREEALDIVKQICTLDKIRRKAGIYQYEAVLLTLNLPSAVPKPMLEILAEMHGIRNMLAHGDQTITSRFAEKHQTKRWKVGDPILVTTKDWVRYQDACVAYRNSLMDRVLEHVKEDIARRQKALKRRKKGAC